MTLGEMRSYTRILLGDDDTDQYFSDSQLDLFINEGNLKVAEILQCLVSFDDGTTVAYNDSGLDADDPLREGRYPLPYDTMQVKDIVLWNGGTKIVLKRLTHDEYEEQFSTVVSGVPRFYRLQFGATSVDDPIPGDFKLGPYPNAAYSFRIYVYQKPSKLTDEAQTSELPSMFHKMVCYYAALELSMKNNDTPRSVKLAEMFRMSKEEAMAVVGRYDRTGPMHFKKQYGSGKWAFRRRR